MSSNLTFSANKDVFMGRHDSAQQQARSIDYHNQRYSDYISRWKKGLESGMRGKTSISNNIRKYLFEKYDNKCSLCKWTAINPTTGKVPL